MTQQELIEEKNQETMECISGMIRYGYQEAIYEIKEFVQECGDIQNEAFHVLIEKLKYMTENKKNINLEKLQKEIETYAKPKPTSK